MENAGIDSDHEDEYEAILQGLTKEDESEEWKWAIRASSRDLKSEAMSTEHMLIHKPWNPHCKVCQVCKNKQPHHRRKVIPLRTTLRAFGDIVTCDHLVSNNESARSSSGHTHGFMLYDIKTQFVGAYPCLTKSGVDTLACLRQFMGSDRISRMYSDNSGEIEWACNIERIPHDTAKPNDPQSNGIAEQMIYEVKLGTSTNLEQAGLPHCFWDLAMRHFTVSWKLHQKAGPRGPLLSTVRRKVPCYANSVRSTGELSP